MWCELVLHKRNARFLSILGNYPTLALAGFSPDEVTITAEQNVLTVEGSKAQKPETEFLYQGISARPFRRVFNLADYVQVKNASFENGLPRSNSCAKCPR